MDVYAFQIGSGSLFQRIDKITANRIRKGYVSSDAAAEERRGTLPCAIEELIREDYVRFSSSRSEPTALAEMIRSTPRSFIA